jgi:hypothetical protein
MAHCENFDFSSQSCDSRLAIRLAACLVLGEPASESTFGMAFEYQAVVTCGDMQIIHLPTDIVPNQRFQAWRFVGKR